MEQKLLDLKEQFCKWYCSGRERVYMAFCEDVNDLICHDCNNEKICIGGEFDICKNCQVSEYIRFIRNDL